MDQREPFARKMLHRAAAAKGGSKTSKVEVVIWYADHIKRQFETIATNFEAQSVDVPFGQGLVSRCLDGSSVYFKDIADFYLDAYHPELVKIHNWNYICIRPVIVHNTILGAIGFYSQSEFNPDVDLSYFPFPCVEMSLFCLDIIRDSVRRDRQISNSLLSLDIGRVAEDRFHDIEEQLFGAIGAIGAIRTSKSIDPTSNLFRNAILAESQIKKASEFTKKYLQEARNPDHLNLKLIDVNTIIHKIAKETEMRAKMRRASRGQSIDVRTTLHQNPLMCLVDIERIYRCITNIVTNAEYWVLRSEDNTRRIDITTDDTGSFAAIKIRDTGPGIVDKDRIFEPGYSLRGGTGLGLAIARRVISLHGGHIESATELRRWTSFHVSLPMSRLRNK